MVVDSRLHGDGDQVLRRCQCAVRKERFTTCGAAELNLPRVVKSDGRRVDFDGRACCAQFDLLDSKK